MLGCVKVGNGGLERKKAGWQECFFPGRAAGGEIDPGWTLGGVRGVSYHAAGRSSISDGVLGVSEPFPGGAEFCATRRFRGGGRQPGALILL
jgi:hypothetical protein